MTMMMKMTTITLIMRVSSPCTSSADLCLQKNTHQNSSKLIQVRPYWETDVYPHMPILRPHAARFHKRRISSVTFTSAHLYANVYMRIGVARALANSSDFRRLLGEQSSPKMCDSLPWTPTNRHAKYDAASFILGGEIRNRTNTQKTNRNRYINT